MKPPRIIELIGVAGAGKSTLAQSLCNSSKRIVPSDHPYFRDVEYLPFFVRNTLMMMPTFIQAFFARDGINSYTSRQIARLVILNGWYYILQRKVLSGNAIFVMDQGPIAIMAETFVLFPKTLLNQPFKKWFERTIKAWSDTLDLLIWLDTSDPTLIERVRTRNKWHLIKDQTDNEALDMNTSYRSVYYHLMAALTKNPGGPEIVEFDTEQESVDAITEKVLVALGVENCKVSLS